MENEICTNFQFWNEYNNHKDTRNPKLEQDKLNFWIIFMCLDSDKLKRIKQETKGNVIRQKRGLSIILIKPFKLSNIVKKKLIFLKYNMFSYTKYSCISFLFFEF